MVIILARENLGKSDTARYSRKLDVPGLSRRINANRPTTETTAFITTCFCHCGVNQVEVIMKKHLTVSSMKAKHHQAACVIVKI